MRGDEFFCRSCMKRWAAPDDVRPAFCGRCYGKDIVNITEGIRADGRKKREEDAARKRRDERLRREKENRTKILKGRDAAKRYYRGKNK